MVIALTRVQDLTAGLVETHGVHMGSLFKPVKIFLDDTVSLQEINFTIQLDVAFKLAEGALNPTFYVIDEGIK